MMSPWCFPNAWAKYLEPVRVKPLELTASLYAFFPFTVSWPFRCQQAFFWVVYVLFVQWRGDIPRWMGAGDTEKFSLQAGKNSGNSFKHRLYHRSSALSSEPPSPHFFDLKTSRGIQGWGGYTWARKFKRQLHCSTFLCCHFCHLGTCNGEGGGIWRGGFGHLPAEQKKFKNPAFSGICQNPTQKNISEIRKSCGNFRQRSFVPPGICHFGVHLWWFQEPVVGSIIE